jgi:hypothetical protein
MKIGLIGYGHLGKIHASCIQNIAEYEFVGVYDPSDEAKKAAKEKGLDVFDSQTELIRAVDVVDIVTPTPTHFDIASKAIQNDKHLFIEKPLTYTVEEARELKKMVDDHNLCLQVGHVERFNPAFLSLEEIEINPGFIEGHRLAPFNPRGTDVSVVLDLMIHDLDMILHLTNSKAVDVQSHGVSIVSKSHDICNARIRFENGCVVNLTASRISLKQMRKLRLFQSNAYISMDFLTRSSEIVRLLDADEDDTGVENLMELDTYNGKKKISLDVPAVKDVNAIEEELRSLHQSITASTPPKVSIEDGLAALELAYWIMDENKGG